MEKNENIWWPLLRRRKKKKEGPFRRLGTKDLEGQAPIQHGNSLASPCSLSFACVQGSMGRPGSLHNANHSRFPHSQQWLICKDDPSSSNTQPWRKRAKVQRAGGGYRLTGEACHRVSASLWWGVWTHPSFLGGVWANLNSSLTNPMRFCKKNLMVVLEKLQFYWKCISAHGQLSLQLNGMAFKRC